jgi:hypothetical protein
MNEKKSDESRLNSEKTAPDDLDQYGVWVKAGPETVEEESADLEGFELSDLSEEGAELTSEEEELLGDLESGTPEPDEEPLDINLDTVEEDFSLDDMDDLSIPEESPKEESLDLDFDDPKEMSLSEEPAESNEFDMEEKDFLQEDSLDLDFDLDEEPLDAAEEIENTTIPTAEEGIDSLEIEELEQSSFEELPELEIDEDLISETEAPELTIAAPVEEEVPVEFNDLEAVEMEMTEVPAEPKQDSAKTTQDILSKIEAELSTIKDELAELKRELSYLRPMNQDLGTSKTESSASEDALEDDGGFFDEDEDETIALTGDELDNILNTADITEEKGESDVLPEDIDLGIAEDLDKPLSEHENIISLEEPSSLSDTIPVTTPEEQAIIEEYNRELDQFGNEEFHIDDEDSIDEDALDALPAENLEKDDLLDIGEPQAPETIISENEDETSSPLEEIVLTEEISIPEEISPEDETVEFDLDALEETEIPVEEPEEAEEPSAFEEELEEMEIFIPEEPAPKTEKHPSLMGESPELEIGFEEESLPEELPEEISLEEEPPAKVTPAPRPSSSGAIPENLRDEIKIILKYMDQLLESLPEDKIQEFAHSEHFEVYRRLFEELELE